MAPKPFDKISKLEIKMQGMIMLCRDVPRTTFWAGGENGQYVFAPPRKWAFDFAWPELGIALECQGGIFARKGARRCRVCKQVPSGAHTNGKGYERDIEKWNAASALGWRLVWATADTIKSGKALDDLTAVFHRQASSSPEEINFCVQEIIEYPNPVRGSGKCH